MGVRMVQWEVNWELGPARRRQSPLPRDAELARAALVGAAVGTDRAFDDKLAEDLRRCAALAIRAGRGDHRVPDAADVKPVARRLCVAVDHQRARRQGHAVRRRGARAGAVDHGDALCARHVVGAGAARFARPNAFGTVGEPDILDLVQAALHDHGPHRFVDPDGCGQRHRAPAGQVLGNEAHQHGVGLGLLLRRAVDRTAAGAWCHGAQARRTALIGEHQPLARET